MMGRGAWGELAKLTGCAAGTMVLMLELSRRLGLGLVGVWLAISGFNLVNLVGVLWHHLRVAPRLEAARAAAAPAAPSADGMLSR